MLVDRLAQEDADGHRRHAIKQARDLKDARGYRRAPATMGGYHVGRTSPSKGRRFPATPPTDNEVVQMYALAPTLGKITNGACPCCGQGSKIGQRHLVECINPHSERRRALMMICWRGGLRIACEALKLWEHHLHPDEGYLYVERGKNGKARTVGIDDWVWPYLTPWLQFRQNYPAGPLFCVLEGPTAGIRPWSDASFRRELHALAKLAGVRSRVAPHQLRHASAVGQRADGIDTLVISRNLGHSSLAVTDIYFRGVQGSEIVQAIRSRPMPRITMSESLRNEGIKPSGTHTPDLMGSLATARREATPA